MEISHFIAVIDTALSTTSPGVVVESRGRMNLKEDLILITGCSDQKTKTPNIEKKCPLPKSILNLRREPNFRQLTLFDSITEARNSILGLQN